MVYNYVNGKLIMAKMYDEFNIKSRDWENRAPKWIADAMAQLHISVYYEEVAEAIPFNDYKFKLPCDIKLLRGIVVDGKKLSRTNEVAFRVTNTDINNYVNEAYLNKYSISAGYIHLEKESGVAKIIYRRMPIEWDDILGMWIPMIPDIPEVIDNIAWYVLRIILARGYNHPVYKLTTNTRHANPDLMWRHTKKAARIRAQSLDNEGRRLMAETLSTFISNPNADMESLFSEHTTNVSSANNFIEYWNRLSQEFVKYWEEQGKVNTTENETS